MPTNERPLYGCLAVMEALDLSHVVHCDSCHSEMNHVDETPGVSISHHCGTLPDGREYEEVCCGVSDALKEVPE